MKEKKGKKMELRKNHDILGESQISDGSVEGSRNIGGKNAGKKEGNGNWSKTDSNACKIIDKYSQIQEESFHLSHLLLFLCSFVVVVVVVL